MANGLHRLGEYIKEGKENTTTRMTANWPKQNKTSDYWEFDVSDTADKNLIVRHDRKISGNHTIDYTVAELKAKEPWLSTLGEMVTHFRHQHENVSPIKRDILCEMKRIYADEAKQLYIDQILRLRSFLAVDGLISVEVQGLCFNKGGGQTNHFEDIFTTPEEIAHWKPIFAENKINILEVENHGTDCFKNNIFLTKGTKPVWGTPVIPPLPIDPTNPSKFEVGQKYEVISVENEQVVFASTKCPITKDDDYVFIHD